MTTIKSDLTGLDGVRHVTIQTKARGNDQDGYHDAERQAKEWFFRNYGVPIHIAELPLSDEEITGIALSSRHLDPSWLNCPHPRIESGRKQYMFGHHLGLNPKSLEATWDFEFEVVPV